MPCRHASCMLCPPPSPHLLNPLSLRSCLPKIVGDTPVIKINKLAPEGITMYVKAEFFNPCSSVKDR